MVPGSDSWSGSRNIVDDATLDGALGGLGCTVPVSGVFPLLLRGLVDVLAPGLVAVLDAWNLGGDDFFFSWHLGGDDFFFFRLPISGVTAGEATK